MELVNESPYAAERAVLQNGRGVEILMVVVKATYRMRPDRFDLAPEQIPIQLGDSFHGVPGESSLRYESDLSPPKSATDVVLIGSAHAPGGSAAEVDVSVSVGRASQTIRVFGERAWTTTGGAPRPTRPLPFKAMPLVYERAFGGVDTSAEAPEHHDGEPQNPVGVGFRAEHSLRPLDGEVLPNLEDPMALIASPADRPGPVGFGMIARSWMPRRRYAGSYDARWQRDRAPLPPEDFDERFFQSAPPRMCSRRLAGGEPIFVSHASPTGRALELTLPSRKPRASITMGGTNEPLPLALDLLALEPDDERAVLVWRGARPIGRELFRVDKIRVEDDA